MPSHAAAAGHVTDPKTDRLRILLADDHLAVREGLKALLEREGIEVVAEAADGKDAVRAALELSVDVVILDFAMPGLNGVEAAREITAAAPGTAIILLSGITDTRFALQAVRAGVRGFVMKMQRYEELLEAIRAVSRGGLYLTPTASKAMVEACVTEDAEGRKSLSPREREVVQLVAEGRSNKEIGEQLGISVKTAEFHRGRVMEKLQIHNTAGLVRYAIREGLISA
ncbi:MAG TPA: response regulator transcription factor [Gemmatimonadales bacterium]|nr:response regulator transcription factor [Gemmatimonadales bacterium]